MSCGYLEFVKVRLVLIVIAENDDVPTCHSSCLVSCTADLGLVGSTALDQVLKLAKLVCRS